MCDADEQVLSCRRISLCQKLPADFVEIPAAFQRHVIGLQIMNNYTHSKTGNTDERPVYFSMPSNDGVNDIGQNTWCLKHLVTNDVTIMVVCRW